MKYMQVKRILLACMLCLLPLAVAGVELNGTRFNHVYSGKILPQDSMPSWRLQGSAAYKLERGGWLRLQNQPGRTGIFIINDTGQWQGWGEDGLTIELRVRVVEQTADRSAATIWLSNGSHGFAINLASDRVFIGSNPASRDAAAMPETEFATIRLVVEQGGTTASVYLNGTPVMRGVRAQRNDTIRLYFGSPSPHVAGISDWEYLAWTPGAHPPANY